MSSIASKISEFFLKKRTFYFFGTEQQKDIKLRYSSLSPIGTGDENGHYSNALLWALENRKAEGIKNIALTGPYGSGKSSILKTFQTNYQGKDLKFLNISLATFKEEEESLNANGNPQEVDKNALLRLLETSILEQIFYHEEDKNIPDSRFKKIRSYSNWEITYVSFGMILFLISVLNYIKPELKNTVLKDITFSPFALDLIHYVGISIIFLGISYLIFNSVRILSAVSISKLKIKNAEIGIGEHLNKSVLNHHIDEILYFFSIRPYNVVIIEDLDRFRRTEIFTKLREVNLLLNNSKKTIRKNIVFIYAVRDDMFLDKERTKFFDFIIPIIPIINSSNSSEILYKKRKDFEYKISDSLIEDISFFIDDMRLLHNICNEFSLYKDMLDSKLVEDKLFAMITYKNMYPNDFMKLSCNDGEVFNILNRKNELIKDLTKQVDTKILRYKKRVRELEKILIDNIADLRRLYIIKIINSSPGLTSFVINNQQISIEDVIQDQYFEYIKTDNYQYTALFYNQYGSHGTQQHTLKIRFKEVELLINDTKLYSNNENDIAEIKSGGIRSLKQKIVNAEKEKLQIKKYKFSDLLQSHQLNIEITDKFIDPRFISILLRNGYIAEDFIDYISLFHEETITRADYQFHISVKSEIVLPYDYKLSKIDKLILKINSQDFHSSYILNFDMLDHILSNSEQYHSELKAMLSILKDETTTSINFTRDYFEVSKNIELFTKHLCKEWTNIWNYIETNPDFSDELKELIFKYIIDYSDVDDIIKIANQSAFKQVIISNPLFLNITTNSTKLKTIISSLDIIFEEIDFDNCDQEMLGFVYKNNRYQLNVDNIASVINEFGEFNKVEFDTANYAAIKNSNASQLITYINNNLNAYIEKIYFKISTNRNENEKELIELLNTKDIKHSLKADLIIFSETKVVSLSSIADKTLHEILLLNNKVSASWNNLLDYYNTKIDDVSIGEDDPLPEEIIIFINNLENAQRLSEHKMSEDHRAASDFCKKLLEANEVTDSSYDSISKSSPWWYSDLNFGKINRNKIISAINNFCVNPTKESFKLLKTDADGLNIYLLEKRKNKMFEILDELEFDGDDLSLILSSTILKNNEKQAIIKKCSDEVISTDENYRLLSPLLLSDSSITVSDNILKKIMVSKKVLILERIKLFIMNANKCDISQIENFLISLGSEFVDITKKDIKAKIPKNDTNIALLTTLEDRGYISSTSEKADHMRVNHKRR